MHRLVKVLLSFGCLVSIEACDQRAAPPGGQEQSVRGPLAQDLGGIEATVRIAEANKRIDDLERQVGKLESTPEKLDLDLLTQRVVALEARAAGVTVQPDPASSKQRQGDAGSRGSDRRSNDGSTPISPQTSNLTLPDMEGRSRLATPAEAKAFSRGN